MAELLVWSGRIYPAATLALLGAGLVVLGIRSLRSAGRQRRSWPEWALTYLYVFRASVVEAGRSQASPQPTPRAGRGDAAQPARSALAARGLRWPCGLVAPAQRLRNASA